MLTSAQPAPVPGSDDIESLIGEATAVAALALMAALQEFQNNGLTRATRTAGGDAIGLLWELRQATLTEIPDFEDVARVYGTKALQARRNGSWCPRQGGILVDSVLEILEKVSADAAALRLH